ncbi:MAG: DUF2809 domain-containing protein [Cloacibacterium sp.]|nr:DUF2809 domain-containing protein [Cloacibacterium sp.]
MKFSLKYFMFTMVLFLTEVAIATVFKDIVWLRAYFGDVLVVMLIYTFIQTFFSFSTIQRNRLIVGIFIFACCIEFLQYFHFGELLGFKANSLAMIVLGNSFSWIDILCYAIGCFIVYILNRVYLPK